MAQCYVIVWERFSFLQEIWTPYNAAVSRLLDRACFKSLSRAELGDAEPALANLHVNFVDMKEFGSTQVVPVRRAVYPGTVPVIGGITWEFCSDNWFSFPYMVQNQIEMGWLRRDPNLAILQPDSTVLCVINLERECVTFNAIRATYAIRRSISIPYAILKQEPNAGSTPVIIPEGWRIAVEAPKQQAGEQMHQGINLAQSAETASQVMAKEQPTGEELGVLSLAKRFGNFSLGKSSDAPSTSSAPQNHQQCQAQVQQQLKGELPPLASMPHGPPGMYDEPGFPGASVPRSKGITLEKKPLLPIGAEINMRRKRLLPEAIKALAFDAGYLKLINPVPIWMQPCPVCQLDMLWRDDGMLIDYPVAFGRCQHMVHMHCLLNIVQQNPGDSLDKVGFHVVCPTCHVIYGTKIGCQPHGTMDWAVKQYHLPGHEDCCTIEITYNFQSSVQNKIQPRPGKPYFAVGFPRRCFLPYNKQGRLILTYLREAFNRRILFTIGRSATTDNEDIVLPCVQHKTKVEQFPDPPFFQRVIQQLVNLGVAD